MSGDLVLRNCSGDVETEEEGGEAMAIACCIIMLSFVINRWAGAYWAESVTTIAIGAIVGGILHATSPEIVRDLKFDERTFVFFILPPIIYDAGFSLRHHGIVDNALVILTLAVFGTVVTALVIGGLIHAVAPKLYPELSDQPVWETFCFAALLSAIDPVAVISVLGRMFTTPEWKKRGAAPPRIFYVIFGESVLNDAVAIVIFKIFEQFLESGEDPTAASLFKAAGIFLYICTVSVVIGWAVAAASALLLKNFSFHEHPSTELTILLILSFGSYYVTEAFGMSGIIALFVCGRTTGHYTWHNLSTVSQVTAPQLIHWLASVAETYVYAFLGLAFFSFEHDWRWGFTWAVVGILLLSRFICVFPLVGFCNCLLPVRKRLSMATQLFMSLTGLRGAIAFGLALSTTSNKNFTTSTQMVSTTLWVVVLTVTVFGSQAERLFKCLGLRDAAAKERDEADPVASVTSKSKFLSVIAFESKHIAPRLRVADHRSQHMRRAEDMNTVLSDLQNRFAIRDAPEASPTGPQGDAEIGAQPPPAEASEPTRGEFGDVQMEERPPAANDNNTV